MSPSDDQRSTVTRKNEQSTSLEGREATGARARGREDSLDVDDGVVLAADDHLRYGGWGERAAVL